MASSNIHDLLIVADATASMGSYLASLNRSLPEVIRISALTGCFERIGVVAYRDYNGGKIHEWSGWYGQGGTTTREGLLAFTKGLRAEHGGDWPEAAKTGLARAYEVMRPEARTIMLLYADAPPHMPCTGGHNRMAERTALTKGGAFGGKGKLFVDWVSASKTLATSQKKAQVFCIIHSHLPDTLGPYVFLSHQTGGTCLRILSTSPDLISQLSLATLLAWMGVEKDGAKPSMRIVAKVLRYNNITNLDQLASEDDKLAEPFLVLIDTPAHTRVVMENILDVDVKRDELKKFIVARDDAQVNFSKRYMADEEYRNIVVENLTDIMQTDVSAMAVNPVFGSLWRTVCNDRNSDHRDRLIEMFGREVDKIADPEKRARMKTWLEESYDYAGEINALIASIPEEDKFPCVYLDPTIDFRPAADDEDVNADDKEAAKALNEFTREELLEIGRSCDYRILRRLGRLLTRLSYVQTQEELPEHIRTAEVPCIPLAMAAGKYHRKFWKVLLHVVLPGTMLSGRPAALLAALSLRIGLTPLQDAADAELLSYKTWNTLDIPETWNTNCLSLLLEADKNYKTRVTNGITKPAGNQSAFLGDEDRQLFEALVDYKLLELNLSTTLTAKIGWHPDKTRLSLGPVVVCQRCRLPRSVTIMSASSICGLCDYAASAPEGAFDQESLTTNVSSTDNEQTPATWVECGMSYCRAQYVVYCPDSLNVRPKCHYCRFSPVGPAEMVQESSAPTVECTKCLSHMIYPEEYRPSDLDLTKWQCPACLAGRKTIVDTDTTAKDLMSWNGRSWLLANNGGKIAEPFNGRTLFHVISTAGTDDFASSVAVLPEDDPRLTIHGKLVRNAAAVVTELRGWIASRRAQAGTCSLCFSSFRQGTLRPACGRRGCGQHICPDCVQRWYGLNARGRIINIAALTCPFCRRVPRPGIVEAVQRRVAIETARDHGGPGPTAAAATGTGAQNLAFLGNLRDAVRDQGTWIYAWCWDCGLAKRFGERACARGAPPPVDGWRCEECAVARAQQEQGAYEAPVVIKDCPGCKTPTERISGCGHVECTMPDCGVHWCFFCGEEQDESVIYEHMSEEHGGYYGEEFDEDDY